LTSRGITRATGLPPPSTARARRTVVGGVGTKQGESWIATKDKVLPKAGFTMTFAIPKADRAMLADIFAGTIVGRLNVSEVGDAQLIRAPETLGPFSDVELALDAVGLARQARNESAGPPCEQPS
jgi:hypothetical protein